jgi:Domain of unknown function (DUF5615)
MTRPRFLADHNLNAHIVEGVRRREPMAEFIYCHDVGMQERPDGEVLAYAADSGLIVVSHDMGTMKAAAYARIASSQPMPGLFLVKQRDPIGPIIDYFVAVWFASEAEEWRDQVRYLPL